MLVLGHVPTKAELLLRKGADFTWTLIVNAKELLPDDTTVTLYVYERDGDNLIGFWPALMVPGEIIEGEVIPEEIIEGTEEVPEETVIELVAGNPKVVVIPAVPAVPERVIPERVLPDTLVPDQAQLQIYSDDHAVIPHGAKFLVVIEKPGFPKTAWLEGRVSKANR
jgi:hypothetical protein